MTKLITGKAAIMAAITAASALGTKWENSVQVIALSVMQHSAKHREVSLINSALKAMPKGARTNALIGYFEKFSCATFVEKIGKVDAHFTFDKDKKTDMVGAQKTTWATFIPEPTYKPLDLCDLLTKLVARAERDKKTDYSTELLDGIKALTAKHAEPETA